MTDLDAIYRVIHQPSGHVVDDYTNEASALACVERENEEYPDSHVVVKYVRADQAPPAAVDADDKPGPDWKYLHGRRAECMARWHARAVELGYDGVNDALEWLPQGLPTSVSEGTAAVPATAAECDFIGSFLDLFEDSEPNALIAKRALAKIKAALAERKENDNG